MTTPPVPTTPSAAAASTLSDPDLIKSINDKVRSMMHSYRSSVGYAIEVGELLKEAKARAGHGNFESVAQRELQSLLQHRSPIHEARRQPGTNRSTIQIV